MKYWGKKPHNIWGQYIENYAPENGVCLDPFAGCAMSAFETVKAGRKAIAFDLNPLTAFIIEVMCTKFDYDKFKRAVDAIMDEMHSDDIYLENFITECPQCGSKKATIVNYKWNNGVIYEVAPSCPQCASQNLKPRIPRKPTTSELAISNRMNQISIPYWYPEQEFYESPSFSQSFISNLGGNKFTDLWTKRNLYILSKIYDRISNVKDEDLKKQLLFGFIQTIHLCSKMCVPRNPGANRPYSTSWGRSAYLCSARQMEMNPLSVFYGSCIGKQSVSSALNDFEDYVGKMPKLLYVGPHNKSTRSKNFDIKYGIVDINTIPDYVDEKSIDFIITDPPYGGLVQYLDLSTLWLIWLENYDSRFKANYNAEITIKNGIFDIETYERRFTQGIKNLRKVLKDDSKIVITFHNKNVKIWNAFLKSVQYGGFKIEKVIHQQNRRTGESNVANPYGTSAADFYIRCVKSDGLSINNENADYEHEILTTAIQTIAQRNEPTAYQVLYDCLLKHLINNGYIFEDFDRSIEEILKKYVGSIFKLIKNDRNRAGCFWWFENPGEYIKYPNTELSERVEQSIIAILRRKTSVTLDEVLGDLFVRYPDGLTPNRWSIQDVLGKYAIKSGGRWIYNSSKFEVEFTKHTEMIYKLLVLGKKLGFGTYVGKREQPEPYNGRTLRDYCDITNLELNYAPEKLDRIGMVDLLWIKDNKIEYAFEVENSTNFTSGIQRASNMENEIPKIMVIPDHRTNEFLKLNDPYFVTGFNEHNWRYMNYTDLDRLCTTRNPKLSNLDTFLRNRE